MAISYVVLKLSRIFERGAESAPPPSGARANYCFIFFFYRTEHFDLVAIPITYS